MNREEFIEKLVSLGVEESIAERLKTEIRGGDYVNLINYMKVNDTRGISSILIKYGVKTEKNMSENDYLSAKFQSLRTGRDLDETFGVMTPLDESFTYAVEVTEQTRDRVLDWLDENKVSYQATSPLHYRVECSDRDGAYRTGRALSSLLGKPTVRDSQETISESYQADISFTIDEVDERVESMMKRLVQEYQQHTTSDKTIPAGPDTSKFSTTQKGMITYVKGLHSSGGYYGFARFFEHFVKVGGAVPARIEIQMRKDFLMMVSNLTQEGEFNEKDVLKTSDGYKIRYGEVNGSAWGGFGLWYEKPKVEEIEEKMSKDPKNRIKNAKEKMADMTPRNPVVTAAKTRSGGGAHGKSGRKDDEMGRKAKYKPRFDEQIDFCEGDQVMVGEDQGTVSIPLGPDGTIGVMVSGKLQMVAEAEVSRLDEGVMGMTKLNPLFRLRELAGLTAGPETHGIEIPQMEPPASDGPLAPGPVDLEIPMDMELDSSEADTDDSMNFELGSDELDTEMDLPEPTDMEAGMPGDLPPENPEMAGNPVAPQSEAMSMIEDSLNSVQAMLADIRLAEYRVLIRRLQDLTNQVQMMGRDYLGESRRKK